MMHNAEVSGRSGRLSDEDFERRGAGKGDDPV
jgi:hypothetical protein